MMTHMGLCHQSATLGWSFWPSSLAYPSSSHCGYLGSEEVDGGSQPPLPFNYTHAYMHTHILHT